MTCEINLEGLYMMVKKRLDTISSTGAAFDTKALVKEIHDLIEKTIMDKTKDPNNAKNQALAYARMVPTVIRQGMMSDFTLFSKATEKGFDFKELAVTEFSFTKDIREVSVFLAPAPAMVSPAATMQQKIDEIKKEEKKEKEIGIFQEEIEQQKKKHGKYGPTFFSTTGAEFKGEPWLYKLQRKILKLVNKQTGEKRSGQFINLPGVGNVMLRLYPTRSLGEMHWMKEKKDDGSYKLEYIPKDDDVAYVLVDTAGNILYFDDKTGELSSQDSGGRIAYWNVFKPGNLLEKKKDGSMSLRPYLVGEAKSDSQKIAKKQFMGVANHYSDKKYGKPFDKLSEEDKKQVINVLEEQLVSTQMLHDYAIENFEAQKFIDYDIVGGTLGYRVTDDMDLTKKVTLSALSFLNEGNFQIELMNIKGDTYPTFTYNGKTVRVKTSPGMSEELAEMLTTILLDNDIVDENGKPLTYERRMTLLETFVYPGKHTRVIQGKVVYFRFNDDQLQVIPKRDGSSYIYLIPTLASGKHDLKANVVNITDNPNNRQLVKDYFMKAEFLEVSKHFSKNPLAFAIPRFDQQPDGTRKLRMEPMYYHSFVRNTPSWYIQSQQDPSGESMYRDSYFTIEPNSSDYDYVVGDKLKKDFIDEAVQEETAPKKKSKKKKAEKTVEAKPLADSTDIESKIKKLREQETKALEVLDFEKAKALQSEREKMEAQLKSAQQVSAESPKTDTGVKTQSEFDKFMDSDENVWDKLKMQKTGNIEASKAQLKAAEKWYESSPLKQHIPFRVMFNAVNSRNPHSVAEFSTDGIILYKGSDFSDVYHEAWHGFSQTFLTHAQRSAMYKEVSKKKGTFRDYDGKLVEFAFASEKQLEEYLAEKFREFMLSDGVKADSQTPKTNNIFRRILNFLKELFGGTTYSEGVMNPGVTKTVDELFDKLRMGNISEFTFDTKNRAYGVLFSTIRAVDEQSATRTKLSHQDTTLMIESVDSIFSKVMDRLNEKKGTNRFSNTLFKTNNNKLLAYKATYKKFQEIEQEFRAKLEKASAESLAEVDDMSVQDIQYYHDLIKWSIENFGSLESIEENVKAEKGLIYAHIQKSRLLSNEDKEAATSDDKDEADTFKNAKGEAFDRGGQDLSLKEMASKEILYIIRGLYKRDRKGRTEKNVFGLEKLNDFDKSWNYLARMLQGTLDASQMYDKLQEIKSNLDKEDGKGIDKDNAALVKQLLDKLGAVSDTVDYDGFHLWTNFWQTFNKTRIPLIQMTLKASPGARFMEVNYMVTLGEAQSSSRQVVTNWENRFATTRTKYIKQTQVDDRRRNRLETVNYLEIDTLMTDPDYVKLSDLISSPNKMFNFLRDVGIVMSYKSPILTALETDKDIKNAVVHIWNTINYLKNKRRDLFAPIRSVEDLFEQYENEDGEVVIENAFNRLGDLRDLEAKYGDVVNSFMVSNAEGNAQFEHSLNSTLTVLVESINKAESFQELYSMPHMAHFDPERNPFIENSIWLKSLFNVLPGGKLGGKRQIDGKPVKIVFENLSGVKTIDEYGNEDGVASASSDPATKFILDFHTFMMRGSPELPRHADKNTSYAAFVNYIDTQDPLKKSRFKYIDDADFYINRAGTDINDTGSLTNSMALRSVLNIMYPYVKSELKRIKTMTELEGSGIDYDYFYMKQGQKFNIFDDVFTPELKKKLIEAGPDNYLIHAGEMESAFIDYFSGKLTEENLAMQSSAGYVDGNVKRIINREIREKMNALAMMEGRKEVQRVRVPDDVWRRNAMMSYTVNSWIHNLEAVTVFYGDLAMYNHEKQEFHKRNAGAGSTGDLYRTDTAAITYARSLERMIGMKEVGYDKKMSYDGTFDTAVFEDTTTQAEFFDQYDTAIRDYFNARYKDPEVAKKKADKVIEKYTKAETKEGDGQGWITLDAYRIMLSLQGKWSNAQENLYRKIAEGENVDTFDLTQFFPVKKVQYWGPLQTQTGPPVMAMHKFSLVPLIPNVIKGTNLDLLHKKMMKQGIDYALFKSGSKIGTVTNATGNADAFYSNEDKRVFDQDTPLTKNTIFMNFLKDQLDTGDAYKEKITIPTQMRKLLVDGFMHVGVPVDFKPELADEERVKRWNAICPGCSKAELEKSRKAASAFYSKYKNYEDQVDALTRKKYEELLKKIDFREVNGKPVGKIENLVKYIRSQFELQDLSDHEKDFIQMGSDGRLKHDLSISFSAEKIEKLLNAIVVKQLVKQKMKGEGLIQVSVAGWEKIGTSRELSTYHLKDGVIQPMQINIALQGDFLKLLKHPMVKSLVEQGNGEITELQALNIMINDKTWLSTGNNKKMVMMTGTRIPVQGHNSMEFMQITEFLPTTAGHMIIAPSELVSKSGGDFDIDKLFTMMPYIKYDRKTGEVTHDSERTENKLIDSQIDLLSTKENFVNLIRPNATDIFDDMAKDLAPDVSTYDPMENMNPDPERLTRKGKPMMSPTRILELGYNIYKQNTNSVGKAVLGIGAVENTYNVLFNRIGMYMNPTNGLTFKEYYELRDYILKHRQSPVKPRIWFTLNGVRKQWNYYDIDKIVKNFGRQVIAMPHNKKTVEGKQVISISNMYDANDENRISDIISQMINGWVDVAKDAWVFNVQGNKELTPSLLYLVQAGVPVEQAVYFVSQPLVRQYVEKQRANKSTFSGPLGTKPHQANLVNYNAKRDILVGQCGIKPIVKDIVIKDNTGEPTGTVTRTWYDKIDAFQKTVERTEPYMEKGFDKNEMRKRISRYNDTIKTGREYVADDFDIAAFLHFLEIEEQAKALTQFKRTTNVDTSRQSTLFEARKKEMAVAELKANGRIPVEMVDKIQKETVIGSFFDVLKWQQEIWGPYFKIRDNAQLNDLLTDFFSSSAAAGVVDDTFNGDYEKFANEFRNDFMVYLYQKELYDFDLKNLSEYKGYSAGKASEVMEVDFLFNPVVFKNGWLYVDKKKLQDDWKNLDNLPPRITGDNVVIEAQVKRNMFNTPEQYYKYVIEKEYLRSLHTLESMKDTLFFKEKLKLNKYLKSKVEDTGRFKKEQILEMITYDEILRDMALTNTYNIKHMFKGKHGDSMAAKLQTILDNHPELKDNYKVLEALGIQKTGDTWNIKLVDRSVDSDTIDLYHENMTELMDPDKIRINTDFENKKLIADFFSKIGVYSILQSGFNTNSMLSLQRIANQDRYLNDITRITHKYTRANNPEKFDPDMMVDYYDRFVINVNSLSNKDKLRFKDYGKPVLDFKKKLTEEQKAELAKELSKPLKESPGTMSYYDYTYDTSLITSAAKAEELVKANPNVIFVYQDVTEPTTAKYGEKQAGYGYYFKELAGKYPNVIGIPTRRSYANMNSQAAIKDKVVDGKQVVDPLFEEMFMKAINTLDEMINDNPDMQLAFSDQGYGQILINANDNVPSEMMGPKKTDSLQTFKMISEALYDNFKYVNPNYKEHAPDAGEFIGRTQFVTDQTVMDQLKFCFGIST